MDNCEKNADKTVIAMFSRIRGAVVDTRALCMFEGWKANWTVSKYGYAIRQLIEHVQKLNEQFDSTAFYWNRLLNTENSLI